MQPSSTALLASLWLPQLDLQLPPPLPHPPPQLSLRASALVSMSCRLPL
jgi:hypothetical protein